MAGGVDEHHEARIGRVENEVQTVRQEMTSLGRDVGTLKADVKGLGAILGRIETGVLAAQEKYEAKDLAGRPNIVAVVSVLITIISIIVGGAWLISGQLSRMDERSQWVMKQVDKNEQRIWVHHGGTDGRPVEAH